MNNMEMEKTRVLESTLENMVLSLVQSTMASLNIKKEMTDKQKEEQAQKDMEVGSEALLAIVENFIYLGLNKDKAVRIAYTTMEEVKERAKKNE